MRQHSIDLLPADIRVRSQAGIRSRRYVTFTLVAAGLIAAATVHTRVALVRARTALAAAQLEANQALATEAKANELRAMIEETGTFVETYDQVAHPLPVSRVVATLIAQLPATVTLDRIDVNAGRRRAARGPRSRGDEPDAAPPRVLTAEVAGFATSDEQIAELVGRLEKAAPFRDVSLDFTRTRPVRGRPAREFRLSFRIDLEVAYALDDGRDGPVAAAGGDA